MKTKLTVVAILATLVSACTTGTYMTKAYDDDIYFSPADVPPVAISDNEAAVREKSAQMSNNDTKDKKIVLSQIDRNADGTSSVNNYIYQPDNNGNPDNQNYNMDDQELTESDTTVYYNDDDVKYVINNYYDENDNDLDFAYRINRFHHPYFYSPFFYDDWMYGGYYSPWYSGYYGMNYGWGYDGWYGGFGYPYSYYGYYSPFAFGFGGYWGGGYGGYYNGYYNGYYSGYYGTGGGFYNDHQVARRRSTEMNLPGGNSGSNKSAYGDRSLGTNGRSESNSNSMIVNGHPRSRSIDPTGQNQDTKSATIVNDRRTGGRQVSSQTQSGSVRRAYEPSTTGRTYDQGRVVRQSQNYTPSYNKPRIANQSNYNSSNYTRPRTATGAYDRPALRSANSNNQTYSQPRSSSNMRQTYRSSSSYSPGSSSSGSRSSSSYNRSSGSSPSYSTPSRSSGGSSSYGGGGGGSSSSGGGGGSSSSGSSGGGGGGSGSRR